MLLLLDPCYAIKLFSFPIFSKDYLVHVFFLTLHCYFCVTENLLFPFQLSLGYKGHVRATQ